MVPPELFFPRPFFCLFISLWSLRQQQWVLWFSLLATLAVIALHHYFFIDGYSQIAVWYETVDCHFCHLIPGPTPPHKLFLLAYNRKDIKCQIHPWLNSTGPNTATIGVQELTASIRHVANWHSLIFLVPVFFNFLQDRSVLDWPTIENLMQATIPICDGSVWSMAYLEGWKTFHESHLRRLWRIFFHILARPRLNGNIIGELASQALTALEQCITALTLLGLAP